MGSLLAPVDRVMEMAMAFFVGWTGSYTWAIILITAVTRILISPLFVVQMGSMKRMQQLQPKVKELQAKYKKEPDKLNKEMMELYRTNKVNPIAGCLPMLVQLPILFSIYSVIANYEYVGIPLFFGIPLIPLNAPDPTYVLPVLAAGFTFLQSWLSMTGTDPTQKTMLYAMPVMIFFFSMKVSAGVTLYWVVSTLLTLVQQAIYPGFQRSLLPKGEPAAK